LINSIGGGTDMVGLQLMVRACIPTDEFHQELTSHTV